MAGFPAPAPGDVVWCRFPNRERIQPAKPRPALVLSVMDDASPIRVRVVYGTSRAVTSVRPTEVLIGPDQPAAYLLSGLSRPTKFCLTSVVILDYTDLWFGPAPAFPVRPTPQLGVLHPSIMPALRRAAIAARLLPS